MSKASRAAFLALSRKAAAGPSPAPWRLGAELLGPWAHGAAGELPGAGQALIFVDADGAVSAKLGAGAIASIVEQMGAGAARVELSLGEGASLRWLTSRAAGPASSREVNAALDARSSLVMISAFGLAKGESHAELLSVAFAGKSAKAELVGRYAQDEGSSLCQEVLGHIGKSAAGAEFAQSSKTLRFGNPALSLIEPNLKVEVDEASARHGAAHGAVSAEALHALQARGIDEAQALEMLRGAFLRQPWEAAGATDQERALLKIQKEGAWS